MQSENVIVFDIDDAAWAGTLGGPLLLVPESVLLKWRGAIHPDTNIFDTDHWLTETDYGRACTACAGEWIGTFEQSGETLLSFGESHGASPGQVRVSPDGSSFAVLISNGVATDRSLESAALAAVSEPTDAATLDGGEISFRANNLWLFDSAISGEEAREAFQAQDFNLVQGVQTAIIRPGLYRFKVAEVCGGTAGMDDGFAYYLHWFQLQGHAS